MPSWLSKRTIALVCFWLLWPLARTVAAEPRSVFSPRQAELRRTSGAPPETIGPGRSPSAPQSVFTLAELEDIAQARNPTLAQAAARIQAARGRWVQAGLYPNPKVGYEGTEIGNNGKAGFQGGFVSQEVITGHKLALNREVICREIAQAARQFEAQRFRVLSDVRIEFYDVLIAQRTRELSGELLKFGEQGVTATEKLLKAKEIGAVDLLQARVEAGTAKIALENADLRYDGAWRRLAAVVGMPGMKPVALADDFETNLRQLTWEDSLGRLLACSPELSAARAGVDRARWALDRARVEAIPNVDVRAGVQHDNSSGYDVANVEISIPLPLYNRNQGNIRQAEAELTFAQAEVSRLELDLQSRLAVAFERYATARSQVERYSKDILPDARKSLDLVNSGYSQREFSFLVLLTAQRTYSQTNLNYVNALRELWENTIAIENMLLTGSLQIGAAGSESHAGLGEISN